MNFSPRSLEGMTRQFYLYLAFDAGLAVVCWARELSFQYLNCVVMGNVRWRWLYLVPSADSDLTKISIFSGSLLAASTAEGEVGGRLWSLGGE